MTAPSWRLVAVTCLSALLTACAPSTYLKIGSEPPSVTDLREAQRAVKVYASAPPNATALGDLEVLRCHRGMLAVEPTEELVKDDLLVEALRKGANGMSNATVSKEGGLGNNCWYMLVGKAKALKVPQ